VLSGCGDRDDGSSDRGIGVPRIGTVHLTGQDQHVLLPPHERYGIYVDDADNSGYNLSCTARDAQGRRIHMKSRTPVTISSSATNNLDLVYDTGTGDLRFTCLAPGERITTHRLTGVLH
jgi:hypothetical protein